jgi:hypothetical protein
MSGAGRSFGGRVGTFCAGELVAYYNSRASGLL